jgi:hypothetical protein
MKKIGFFLILLTTTSFFAFGQLMPKVNFGIKGGLNLSKFNTTNTFSSDNQSGYFAGVWARFGAAGLHLQPELYLTGKNTSLINSAVSINEVSFQSLDVPVLIGTKIGAAGFGLRLNTGPVVSFVLSEEQNFGAAASSAFNGNFKDQFYAWQFGAGLDVGNVSVDLRYESGLSQINSQNYPTTKLNLFTLGLGFKLF